MLRAWGMNTPTIGPDVPNTGAAARVVELALGVWLFLSAFVWPHSQAETINAWIVGALAIVFAVVALLGESRAQYLNTALAIWLFLSAFVLPAIHTGTLWNNVLVAIVLFAVSLVPGGKRSLLALRYT